MSKTLLRELLFMPGLQTVELPNSTDTEIPAVLVYVGKQKVEDPTRIEIQEIVPLTSPTIVNPIGLQSQNPAISVDTNYQDLMEGKVCLDNYVDESISCDGAKHEAILGLPQVSTPQDIFPMMIDVGGQTLTFPAGTSFKVFQDTMLTYGVLVGTTVALL